MADNLQPVGVSAVIENLTEYLRGADQLQRATDGMAKGVDSAAKSTSQGGDAVGKFGKDAAQAAKDADGFGTHIGQLADKFGGLFLKLAPIGGAIAGAFAVGKGIAAANDLGASIFRLQQTTNLTAEDASRLKFVFDETGVSLQQGERAIIKFSRALGGVADLEDGIAIPTGKGMADSLYKLGIRTEDAEGKTRPLTEVLGDLADVFQKMPEGVDKTSLATNLFGRSGKDLIPFLNQGKAGMAALSEEADKLGLVLDQNTTNAIRANTLAQKHFHAALEGISVQLGLIFLPALSLAIQVGTKLAVAFNQKVVPVLKIFNGLINFQLQRFVTTFGPKTLRLFQDLGKTISILGKAFLFGFVKDIDFNAYGGKLRPIAALFQIFGAAVRFSVDQIRDLIQFGRIVAEIIRAVVGDFTNLVRIADFLPGPLKDIAYWIFQIILKAKDLITGLFRLGRAVNDTAGGPFDKLRAIAERLGRYAIPALGTAITAFIATLAVGAVVGFVSALGGLASTFANFGPVKLFTDLIGDFVKGIGKTFKIAIDLVGDALQGIGTIAKFLLETAGKAFSFALDVIGNAIDFIKGLTSGFIQGYMDTHPLKQKVIIEQQGQVGVPTQGAGQAGAQAGQAAAKGFFQGLLDGLKDPGAISNVISGVIGALAALAAEAAIKAGVVAAIGAALPTIAVVGALLAAALVSAFVFKVAFEAQGLKGRIALIFGGLVGLGIQKAIAEFIAPAVKRFVDNLPTLLGRLAGALGAAVAIALVGAFLILPGLLFRVIRDLDERLVSGLAQLDRAILNFTVRIARLLITGLVDAGEKAATAFVRVFQGIPGFFEKLPGRIVAFFVSLPTDIAAAIVGLPGVFLKIVNGIVAAVRALPEQILNIVKAIPGIFSDAFDKADDLTHGALRRIIRAIDDFAEGVAQGFLNTWRRANEITGGALDDAVSSVADKLGTIADTVDRFVGQVVGAFQLMAAGIRAAFSSLANIAIGGFDTIKNGILGAVHGIASVIAGVLQDINDAFDAIGYLLPDNFQDNLQRFIDFLRRVGGSATSSPSSGFSQGDINALGGPVQGFASGTRGPLPGATFANVAENGAEIALLGRGRALLPAGSQVLPAGITAALLALPDIARSGSSGGGLSVDIPIIVNGSQIDWDDVRTIAHREVDTALGTVRSRVQRRGSPLTSEIG